MEMGQRIQEARRAQGMTQAALAERLQVSFQAVSSWERGESAPDTDKLVPLCQALGLSLDRLMGLTAPLAAGGPPRDRLFDEERMYTFIKTTAQGQGLPDTYRALGFMRDSHAGQTRKGQGQVPYMSHPLTMCCHALAMGIREDAVLAALLLHDVVEDCGVAPDQLPVGEPARRIVARVSKRRTADGRAEPTAAYFARVGEEPRAVLVKLIDRCHNLSQMAAGFSRASMADYVRETEGHLLPLMEELTRTSPAYSDALFLLKYQMLSLMDTVKRLLA